MQFFYILRNDYAHGSHIYTDKVAFFEIKLIHFWNLTEITEQNTELKPTLCMYNLKKKQT